MIKNLTIESAIEKQAIDDCNESIRFWEKTFTRKNSKQKTLRIGMEQTRAYQHLGALCAYQQIIKDLQITLSENS